MIVRPITLNITPLEKGKKVKEEKGKYKNRVMKDI